MTRTAQLAYGNARVRARKSGLLSSAILVALASAERPDLTVDGWRDLESDADAAPLVAVLYARMLDDYDAVVRAYPSGAALLRALARLHELENVKLTWRAVVNGLAPARWQSLWRPMGPLETVSRDRCATASSLEQLAAAFSKTPFETVAGTVLRAHGGDLAAAEMTFDRWGSATLVERTGAVPEVESVARNLVCRIVCERDVVVLERAIGPLGVAPIAAVRMTAMLGATLGASRVRRLAEWSSSGGAPIELPRLLSETRRPVHTFAEFRRAVHATLRASCHRVFLGDPFSLAPAIALVVLREDELRALISIGELRAKHASMADAERMLGFDG